VPIVKTTSSRPAVRPLSEAKADVKSTTTTTTIAAAKTKQHNEKSVLSYQQQQDELDLVDVSIDLFYLRIDVLVPCKQLYVFRFREREAKDLWVESLENVGVKMTPWPDTEELTRRKLLATSSGEGNLTGAPSSMGF
jgi:hypothetical protein